MSRNLQSKFRYNLSMKKPTHILLILVILLTTQQLTAQSNQLKQLTANNTLSTLIKSKKPVLIKFWAPWCRPCRKMTPKYKKAAQKFTGQVVFAELNIDEHPSVANKYRVRSIPTLILFNNNKIVKRSTGSLSQQSIEKFVHSGI